MRCRAWIFVAVALPAVLYGCGKKESGADDLWERLPAQLVVEIADKPYLTRKGLSGRDELAENRGMLFVFERSQKLSFYMKDTKIPLSIAYIDENWIIKEIHYMNPDDLSVVSSRSPCRYALEVNRGWFERNDIEPGMKVVWESGELRFEKSRETISDSDNI